ncbi:hypothetical protein GGI43DRAFT_414456 [Trichoderma evansii]
MRPKALSRLKIARIDATVGIFLFFAFFVIRSTSMSATRIFPTSISFRHTASCSCAWKGWRIDCRRVYL